MKKKARVKMYCTATVYINEDINGNQEIEEVEDVDEPGKMLLEPVMGNKIGGTPAMLQCEPSYYTWLDKDKYEFVMQFDESSYLRNQIIGNEPFCHGIIYFYGKFENGVLVDLVGGFWQN